jgi:hypothetical protein
LKSRLYDKGISVQTMPSVKRPFPENMKTYAAKLHSQSGNKPPLHGVASVTNLKPPPYLLNSLYSGTLEDIASSTQKSMTATHAAGLMGTRHLRA